MSSPKPPETKEWTQETVEREVEVPTFDECDGAIWLAGTKKVKQQTTERVTYAALNSIPTCPKDEHRFAFVEDGRRIAGRVYVKCAKCPIGRQFIPGIMSLEDSKIIVS